MISELSSDILERQFGPTHLKVLYYDDTTRLICTKASNNDQVLELSYVTFESPGVKRFPEAHREVLAGKSMGKAFRDKGINFNREVEATYKQLLPDNFMRWFGSDKPSSVIAVKITVGPDKTSYATILETYSAVVDWPQTPRKYSPDQQDKINLINELLKKIQRVLIIDNYDSFTYNLYQQIAQLGPEVIVSKNDDISLDKIVTIAPSHIVISPGPKRPVNSGISREVIKHFYQNTPILGVCLGQQCIGEVFGSQTVQAPRIMHGKTDSIHHDQAGLFRNVPNPFTAARYHSLVVDELPSNFKRTAWSDDGSIMGIEHPQYAVYGVQFHPESFMTDHGKTIMKNFLACHKV